MTEYNSNINFFECDCGIEVYPAKHSKTAKREHRVRIEKKHKTIYSSAGNPSIVEDQTKFDALIKDITKNHKDRHKDKFKSITENDSSSDYTELTYERHKSVVNEVFAMDGRPKKIEWICPICGKILATTEWKNRV